MREIQHRFKRNLFSNLIPDFELDLVSEIDIEKLEKIGIKALAIDIDRTLVEPNQITVRPETIEFIKSIKLPVYLATNRKYPRGEELGKIVSAKKVIHATKKYRKPQSEFFRVLEKESNTGLSHIAMIGDRIITDVLGGNKMGMTTIYVEALGKDPWYLHYTGIKKLESFIFRAMTRRL